VAASGARVALPHSQPKPGASAIPPRSPSRGFRIVGANLDKRKRMWVSMRTAYHPAWRSWVVLPGRYDPLVMVRHRPSCRPGRGPAETGPTAAQVAGNDRRGSDQRGRQ
jgi:hypothetical protein